MHNNCNSKMRKSKIDNSYLIVGIDIGKINQYARITDSEGNEIGKKIVFQRDIFGLNQLIMRINTLKLQYKKTKVLVAMEPTGIYWKNVYEGLKSLDSSLECVLVDVKDVINVRSLFFGTVKSDIVDSLAIAKTATLKGFNKRLELNEREQNIKDLNTAREDLLSKILSIKNILTSILDEVFPEYNKLFKDYFKKSSMVFLDTIFCPQDIINTDLQSLYNKIKSKSKTCISLSKLAKIKAVASESIGIKPTIGKKFHFRTNFELLQSLLHSIEEIDNEIYELMLEDDMAGRMMDIKGISAISTANLLSQIGSFDKFNSPKQLISYCGLNLRVNESGKHKGKTTISKRGNSMIRAYLFRVMLPLIKNNDEFKRLHNHFKTRKDNPLKPMQSMIALSCKLLRVLFGMAKNNQAYIPEVAFQCNYVEVA
ncbi:MULTISPECIES: IS110 family transposase [Clostridium]|uniref:IS110 family transposase n=9 Tax=Clostridium senegalense TaxID=1465809 RepID=A0A6M0H7F9_9CLOT|nr:MULTISPECIES: IS110 family transposase [Clostridium]NEU06666.1 IS110 family transposase [Clostridium senegalense]